MSYATPTASSASTPQFDEGLALFITFAILFILANIDATAKLALWIAISLAVLVWLQVITTEAGKTFWAALAR